MSCDARAVGMAWFLLLALFLGALVSAAADQHGESAITTTTTVTTTATTFSSSSPSIPSSATSNSSSPSSSPSSSSSSTSNIPFSVVSSHSLSPQPRASTSSSAGTCASASIDYITHRPSQCWTNTRFVGSTSTGSSDAIVESSEAPTSQQQHRQGDGGVRGTDASASTAVVVIPDTATATCLPSAGALVTVEVALPAELETESPLDGAKFLSFEDWKRQNLPHAAQAQQDARPHAGDRQARARPGLDNALDSLGDEGEIVLDFSGFGGSVTPGSRPSHPAHAHGSESSGGGGGREPLALRKRSRDAGKTCKERSNYASFDCGAIVLKTNAEGRKASSVLVENKDSYMLNECAVGNKFLILELCDEVKIDTVVVANFEFFSSIFRTFRVSVSDRYPVKMDKWKEVGTFEARNTRDMQPFLVEGHEGFARYVRIEFLSHYGSEFYCPVSLVRVHGVTAFEEYKLEQMVAEGQEIDEEDEEVEEATAVLIATATPPSGSGADSETMGTGAATSIETDQKVTSSPPSQSLQSNSVPGSDTSDPTASTARASEQARIKDDTSLASAKSPSSKPDSDSPSSKSLPTTRNQDAANSDSSSASSNSTSSLAAAAPSPTTHSTTSGSSSGAKNITAPSSSSSDSTTIVANTVPPPAKAKDEWSSSGRLHPPGHQGVSVTPSRPASRTASSTVSASHASSPPPPNHPPTQESFFKSINKRLQFLEANSTLSLQYIESQSALLRDAFVQVEKRQLAKTAAFLDILNATVALELTRFQGEYEQIWQSTLMELASQRDENRRERELLGERVRMLAEEIVGQRRLMAAQATILMLCLGLVIFARFGGMSGATIDSGLLQGMQEIVNRGKEARAREKELARREKQQQQQQHAELEQPWRFDSPWSSPSRRHDGAELLYSPATLALRPRSEGDVAPVEEHEAFGGLATPRSANSVEQRDFAERGPPSPSPSVYDDEPGPTPTPTTATRRAGELKVELTPTATQSAPTTPLGVEVRVHDEASETESD